MNQYELLLNISKNALVTLSNLLDKGSAYAEEKGIDESVLLTASLAPDMFNFTKQIQVSTDDARRNLFLLSGKEHIKMEDTETTFAELQERVKKTKEIIDSLTVADFEGADDRHISLYWMGGAYVLGKDIVSQLAIPNLLFHVVTAYDILRAQGVPLGKSDYIVNLKMQQPGA
ncbi:MAG: hypothetical protein JWN37_909 [Candidatus Nomurabacteria bacterium]|nr:hypothetical protein [Candidatus Nomurabacteria bacterium]